MLAIWVLSLVLLGAVHGNEVCYPRLGCFDDNIPWAGTTERPIAKLPSSPERINTRFLLYTKENPNNFQEISAITSPTISYSNFNTTRKTRFIIHGYIDQGEETWLWDMCKRMFQVEDVNCICVDWSSSGSSSRRASRRSRSSKALYTQSAANIRVVGAEIAYLIKILKDEFGHSPSDVHLIGHSMGAHAAGETGKRVKGIARITGLDPTGPFFQGTPTDVRLDTSDALFVDVIHSDAGSLVPNLGLDSAGPFFQGTPTDVRLNTSDALFVDVIHSDAGSLVPNLGLGMSQPIGHLDFFPNGGMQMPGCKKNMISQIVDIDGIWEGTRDFVACNHLRSYKYYSDSIISKEGFVGYPSPTYESFKAGTGFPCPSTGCPLMGHFADAFKGVTSVSQKIYLNTGDAKDFSCYRYNVSVTLTGTSSARGYFNVALYGSKGNTRQYQIFKGKLKSGNTYSAFIDVERDVGELTKIKFLWNNNILNPLLPKMGAQTAVVQNGRDAVRSEFCGSETVRENTLQSLTPC